MLDRELNEEQQELEILLFARTYMYSLFHKLLGGEPDSSVIEVYTSDITRDVLSEYATESHELARFVDLIEKLDGEDKKDLADRAASEYTRLFIGPARPEALPWETPYVTELPIMYSENTLHVRSNYESHGLKAKVNTVITDDHIATMLGFLWQLSNKTRDTYYSANLEYLKKLLEDQTNFLDHHILNWVDNFAHASRKASTAILYPQLIEALSYFVKIDRKYLSNVQGWLAENQDLVIKKNDSENNQMIPAEFMMALEHLGKLTPKFIEECELVSVK